VTQPGADATFPLLVGRDAEAGRLRSLSGQAPDQARTLVVLGEAGIGKSILLADTMRRASAAGGRVLAAAGTKAEPDVPFSGLRELIRPVLDIVSSLPARRASALDRLGDGAIPAGSDRLPVGMGLLALLAEVSRLSPLLVVVDDAHWLDRDSLRALAFAAHRLDSEPIAVLLAGRGTVPLPGFGRGFPELLLPPLTAAAAGRLLDAQPVPPRGRARRQVLAQAAGNPAALIELSATVAAGRGPGAWPLSGGEPLPLSGRLADDIAGQVGALPESARYALLVTAVADGRAAAAYAARQGPDLLIPAEQRGLVKVNAGGVRLTHPFVRAAVYHSAAPGDRVLAHHELAELLRAQPGRRAWHLGAAATRPDERVASLLETEAAQTFGRGNAAEAAALLERAAELSPDQETGARRLAHASAAAISTGEADWIGDLAARALAMTADPQLRVTADRADGWAHLWASKPAASAATLATVATRTASREPMLAWATLADAASAGYQCGAPGVLSDIARVLDRLGQAVPPAGLARHGDADILRLWILIAVGGRYSDGEADRLLQQAADRAPDRADDIEVLRVAGMTAWLLDRTELALRLFRKAARSGREPGPHDPLSALGWAYLDAGRWDEALSFAAAERDFQADAVTSAADLIAATIAAARGVPGESLTRIDGLLDNDPDLNRAAVARARHARGLAALADEDYDLAYDELHCLFADDGSPLHPHVSYLGVADLALASARTGRHADGREVLDRAAGSLGAGRLGAGRSARLTGLLAHARALLADPADPEPGFDQALSVPEGDGWPFERARLRLDYGEWLRRQRRASEARPVLTAALDRFRALGAAPWKGRAEEELRACGVAAAEAAATPVALLELTPVQRRIVVMAASGKTNREIATEMFLSPRTISTYLYDVYPKLGVARRHQLRGVVGGNAEG
jgi:DNA-binding CsgD family transcriptional regulator/tetratricopeptide (TPR) repeat protein